MKFIEDIINRFQFTVHTRICVTNFQGKITQKVKMQELWFLYSARPLMFKGNNTKSINASVMVLALWFLHSARPLMLVDICMKFHDASLYGLKVIERTRWRRFSEGQSSKGNNSKI